MTNMNLPIEVFEIFDRKFGREDALALTKSIEVTLSRIEDHTKELALQRKMEVKEELKIELRSELATKEDIAQLAIATKEDIAKLAIVISLDWRGPQIWQFPNSTRSSRICGWSRSSL